MYAQVAVKSNILSRNGAYGIVMRGVQKCTCAGASLRGKNSAPLCCIIYMTATEIILQRLIQGYEKLKGTPLQGMLAFAG